MSPVIQTLNKVLVAQFYRVNASLFFFIIAFAGGFMRSHDHIALGELLVSTPLMSFIPATAWLAYGLFVDQFNVHICRAPENKFLVQFNVLPSRRQWYAIVAVILNQFAPAIAYCLFLVVLCVRHQLILSLLSSSAALLGILVIFACRLRRCMMDTNIEPRETTISRLWKKNFAKPFVMIILQGVLRQQTLTIVCYKIASLTLFWAIIFLYSTDVYDLRLLGIGATVCFGMSTPFILEWHRFENSEFTIFRRMPLNNLKRLLYAAGVLLTFHLPEMFVLFRNAPQGIADIALIISYGLSFGLLIYAFLYTTPRTIESVTAYIYFLSIVFFVAILAHVPIGLIAFINAGLAVALYAYYYKRFDVTTIGSAQSENASTFP